MQIVFTHHAKERMLERKLLQESVVNCINQADSVGKNEKGNTVYKKRTSHQIVTAITKLTDHGEILVVSAWIDPPNPGTKDAKRKKRYFAMQKATPLKKLWLTVLDQIGL